MLRYLLQRLLVLIPTFLGITLLTFSLIRLIPGDPVEVRMGERTLDPEMHAAALKKLGLDQPLYVQYGRYLADLAQDASLQVAASDALEALLERLQHRLAAWLSAPQRARPGQRRPGHR